MAKGTWIRIGVSNTYKHVLDVICNQFGGAVQRNNPGRERKKHWKIGYIWRASGGVARAFLAVIQPHAQIKQAQITTGLEIHPHRRGERITVDEQQERQLLREHIQKLNKRGLTWGEVHAV